MTSQQFQNLRLDFADDLAAFGVRNLHAQQVAFDGVEPRVDEVSNLGVQFGECQRGGGGDPSLHDRAIGFYYVFTL